MKINLFHLKSPEEVSRLVGKKTKKEEKKHRTKKSSKSFYSKQR